MIVGWTKLLRKWTSRRSEDTVSQCATRADSESAPMLPIAEAEGTHLGSDAVWLDDYRDWLVESVGTVRILDMTDSVPLADLYIPTNLARPTNSPPVDDAEDRRFTDIEAQRRIVSRSALWEPADALYEHRRVAVVGDPGAGKTTMTRYLALQLARGVNGVLPDLPFLVDLHALAGSALVGTMPANRLIPAWIADQIQQHVAGAIDVEEWVTERLRSGEAVLMLDGLDEVADTEREGHRSYRETMLAISAVSSEFTDTPVLITCRRGHIGRLVNLPSGYVLLEALDFEREHVDRFISAWFKSMPETGEALKDQLSRNTRIRGLVANPLTLSLICIIFQRRGSLPQRRADVYRRCADVLLAEWDATRRRDRNSRFTLEHKEDLLRRIAWHFHQHGRRYIRREELLVLIVEFLPMIRLGEEDAEPILDEISAHHGLLKNVGQDWYGFHHFTIQEHFAVEHITSWQRLDEAISWRDRTWWREIIRLYAGKGGCTDLIRRLAGEREDLFQSNLLLIGECLTEGSAVEPTLLDDARSELGRLAHQTTRPTEIRLRATSLAMRLLPGNDAEELARWIADERVPVEGRLISVRHMVRTQSVSTSPVLLKLLANEKLDIAVREALATSLANHSGPEAIPLIMDQLGQESDPEVRQRLALAVGQGLLDHPQTLVDIVIGDEYDVATKYGVAASLGHSTRPEVTEQLDIAAFGVGGDIARVLRIAQVYGGNREYLEEVRSTAADSRIEPWVRTQAITALALRDRTANQDLMLSLVGDEKQDRSIRGLSAQILSVSADDEIRGHLLDLACDVSVNRFVRVAILEGLGECRSVSVSNRLVEMMADDALLEYVRRAVVDAIGHIGDPSAEAPLLAMWHDCEDTRTRSRALLALGRICTERALLESVAALVNGDIERSLRRELAGILRPSSTDEDAIVLDQLCAALPTSDNQSALVATIARFASEVDRKIYPGDIGLKPITYSWNSLPTDAEGVSAPLDT
jgi:HEAT repeat protein